MAPKRSLLLNSIKVHPPLTISYNTQSLTLSTAAYYELFAHWKRLVKLKKSQSTIDAISGRLIARVGLVAAARGGGTSLLKLDDDDDDADADSEEDDTQSAEAYDKAIAEFMADTSAQLAKVYARIEPPSPAAQGVVGEGVLGEGSG